MALRFHDAERVKAAAVPLGLALAILLLAGCGGGTGGEQTDRAAGSSSETAAQSGSETGSPGGTQTHESGDDLLIPVDVSMQPLRRDFEADQGAVRFILVVAPSCGSCLGAVDEIFSHLLPKVRDPDLEVYIVWSSVLVTDVKPRASKDAPKYEAPNVRQYWDGTGIVARAFGRMLGLQQGRNAYDCYFLYDRAATWDASGEMESQPPGQNALISGWIPSTPHTEMTQNGGIKLPKLSSAKLASDIEELLAEGHRSQ